MARNKTEFKRSKKGTFVEGTAPGPGRPPGSISIIGKIKQKFEENPEYFEEWVSKLLEDGGNRKAVMEQIDGRPHQTTDVTSDGKAILQITGMVIKQDGDTIHHQEP